MLLASSYRRLVLYVDGHAYGEYWGAYLHFSVDRDLACEARSDGVVGDTERPRVGLPKASRAFKGDAQENGSRKKTILFMPVVVEQTDVNLTSRPPSPLQQHNWSLSDDGTCRDPALSCTLSSSSPIASLQRAEGSFGEAHTYKWHPSCLLTPVASERAASGCGDYNTETTINLNRQSVD